MAGLGPNPGFRRSVSARLWLERVRTTPHGTPGAKRDENPNETLLNFFHSGLEPASARGGFESFRGRSPLPELPKAAQRAHRCPKCNGGLPGPARDAKKTSFLRSDGRKKGLSSVQPRAALGILTLLDAASPPVRAGGLVFFLASSLFLLIGGPDAPAT
jgi:hypothetical protein